MLFQILVPTTIDGADISQDFHQVWDETVRKIAGGLTILKDCKGKWTSPDGLGVYENMIPVLISCSREQFEIIMDFTLKYYCQQEVFAFVMSSEVLTKRRPSNVIAMGPTGGGND